MPIDNTPTAPSAPRPVIRYANLAGAEVHVVLARLETDRYVWQCTGCLKDSGFPADLDRARTWAAEHAAQCHALPQPTD